MDIKITYIFPRIVVSPVTVAAVVAEVSRAINIWIYS